MQRREKMKSRFFQTATIGVGILVGLGVIMLTTDGYLSLKTDEITSSSLHTADEWMVKDVEPVPLFSYRNVDFTKP